MDGDLATCRSETMSEPTALFISCNQSFKGELNKAVCAGTSYDAIVIELDDANGLGLSDTALIMSQAFTLLGSKGTLLLISKQCALTFGKDELSTGFVTRSFNSPSAIVIRFPLLANFLNNKLAYIRRQNPELVSSLFEHVLLTSVPMRSNIAKRPDWIGMEDEHLVYDTIDGASSVEQILDNGCGLSREALLAAVESLERQGMIYPLLPRAEFLASCYKVKRPFRLGHYMVAAGILSQGQLEVCLERQAEEVDSSGSKPLLGQLVVKAGLISEQLLKSLLEDQSFWGGSQVLASAGILGDDGGSIKTFRGAMIGTLGNVDALSLVQSISSARKNGLLVVEHRDKPVQIKFEEGQPTAAILGDLGGDDALREFLGSWSEGSFVFRDQDASKKMPERSKVENSLQKLVRDSIQVKRPARFEN